MMTKEQQALADLAYKVADGKVTFEEYREAEKRHRKILEA